MGQVQGEETTNCKLLDLPQEMIEEIMIRQDAHGQANFRTTCRTLFDMSKDPFYQSQRDKLAPRTEPVYNFLYLPVVTTEGYPRGWDPVQGAWRVLPSLSFLPKGRINSVSHLHGYRTGTTGRSYNASGLLFLGFLPLSEYSNTKMPRPHTQECLCLCNPLTRKAVFVRPPTAGPITSLMIQGQLRVYASSFTVRQPHWYMVLHTRSGTTARGFTLYAVAGAPSALLKLHVQAPRPAIGAIRVGALDQQIDLGISESNADWTMITRRRPAADGHVQGVSDLIRLADPVVVGGVIRSLCMRERVAQGQAPGLYVQTEYQAVLVDYSMDNEEWEEAVEVRGVPGSNGPEIDWDVFHKLVVVGVADGLWLVHRDKLEDPVTADMAVVHIYAYQPQTKAFLKVDSAPIPDSYIVVQSGDSGSTKICFYDSTGTTDWRTYDVVSKEWSLANPMPPMVPVSPVDTDYWVKDDDTDSWVNKASLQVEGNEMGHVVANFQLSHTWIL